LDLAGAASLRMDCPRSTRRDTKERQDEIFFFVSLRELRGQIIFVEVRAKKKTGARRNTGPQKGCPT
jgi:hypothetical protein